MARYKSTTTSNATLNITKLQQLKDYQQLQKEIYLAVSSGNNDGEVIRLLNTIPTLATLFKGTLGIADVISTLGGYAEEASNKQKEALLDGLYAGYEFFKKQASEWDSKFVSMKVSVPMAAMIDTNKDNKRVNYIRGTGYVVSKTTSSGVSLTM